MRKNSGFTLAEVLVSIAVLALVMGGVVQGYIVSAKLGDWQAYSLAGQSLAQQGIERCRSVKWDTRSSPPVDQLQGTNFPTSTNELNIPVPTTNSVYATCYTTISTITANPPLRMIEVDCVWPFMNKKYYTNSVYTYRAPDQ